MNDQDHIQTIHPAHAPHSVPAISAFPDRLYVVTAIVNPARYRARYRLYRAFEKQVEDAGAILYTVEAAFGHRPFEVTDHRNRRHIQLRTPDELWYKENLLNIGISRLPAEARYVEIVDADFQFLRPDWAQETMQQLQHHAAVQMFSSVTYLGPNHETLNTRISFADRWTKGEPFQTQTGVLRNPVFNARTSANVVTGAYDPPRPATGCEAVWGPPGGAWAFRREALDAVGGLIDYCILGSGDWFMAAGIAGFMANVMPPQYSPSFREELADWGRKAIPAFRKNLGVVPGAAVHFWHGKMSDRAYGAREKILKATGFDPRKDLKRDTNGLWRLHDDGSQRFIRLRDDIRSYFAGRNEDSIDL